MSTATLLALTAVNASLAAVSYFRSGLLCYHSGVDRGWIAIGALNLLAAGINLLNLAGRLAP